MRQDVTEAAPGPVTAAARLDRLPTTPWLVAMLALLFLSWFVESYDIGLTGAVLPSLTHQYHLSTGMKSVVSIAANAGIVIGIVPAGRLADRFGRKPVLIAGTLAYSVLTFMTGLAPSLAAVVTLRVLAGLAMGAVFPLPYIYASELCAPSRRARLTGLADSFLSVGYFVSPLLAMALIPTVEDTTGWRVMFLLGGIPALFALLAWRFLPESPRWSESRGRWAQADTVLRGMEQRAERHTGRPLPPLPATSLPRSQPVAASARAVFQPPFRRRSVMLWATFGGTFFIFYSIQTFMPTVVSKMGFTLTSSFAFTAVIVAVSIPGKLFESWVVERWGRKPVIVGFTALAAVASVAFGFARGAALVLILGCVMSFLGIGVDPAVKAYTAESYPTEIRGWGTSTTEGFGRLISGVLGPALIPVLLDHLGVSSVYMLVGVVALAASGVALAMGHETRGLSLEQSAQPVA
ncbi:MAG TPA: MFS transporter, partial [Acidimicrobiales bacterium]|nr:MFS transporter [Acidimicrobiales bacterium]